MKIDTPRKAQIPELRGLWKTAFADEDAFLDCFFGTAFSPGRCRCVTVEDRLAAALYWFEISCRGERMAYLYAVATDPEFRGRGLCRQLMADTQAHLKQAGYAGAVLVPDGEGLTRMYAGMGYRLCSGVREFTCDAAGAPVAVNPISTETYARLRRQYLPDGGVVQEGENLAFLETFGEFYAGEDFLMAARIQEDTLVGMELLGNSPAAPGILAGLGLKRGSFRTPGNEKPFAMFLPLREQTRAPAYFGLAFD